MPMVNTIRRFMNTPAGRAARVIAPHVAAVATDVAKDRMKTTLKRKLNAAVESMSSKKTRFSSARRVGRRRMRIPKGRSFKSRVMRIINADKPTGVYNPTRHCLLPVISGAHVVRGGQKQRNGSNPDWTDRAGSTFEYFTNDKIKDAAAILYNGKIGAEDSFSTSIGNFVELDTNLKRMGVKWKLFNNSNHSKTIIIHTHLCLESTNEDPLDYCINQIAGSMANNIVGSGYDVHNKNFDPSQVPGFGKKWRHKKFSITLKPGQSKSLYWSQKSFEYRQEKYFEGTTPYQYIAHLSKVMWVQHVTPLVYSRAATFGEPGYMIDKAVTIDRTNILGLEVSEFYKLTAPDTALESNQVYRISKPVYGTTTGLLTNDFLFQTGPDTNLEIPL